jgi:hypothetical protein
MIDAEALHRAAARVGSEYGMPEMDALARAGGDFIQSSTFADELGVPWNITDTQALGYGIMLGYLAALEELE